MFESLLVLDKQAHRDLRMRVSVPYFYAQNLSMTPLCAEEVLQVAREFLIVFPLEGGVPQALLGLGNERNVYVDAQGRWLARYVPAHVRRYPFMLGTVPLAEGATENRQFVLQFVENAPHFADSQGRPLFDVTGQPSELLQRVQGMLMTLQKDFERALAQVAQLSELGLLKAGELTFKQDDKPIRLGGFRLLDEAAFNALPAEALQQLRDSGALNLVYAHKVSMTLLQDGVLAEAARMHRQMAPSADVLAQKDVRLSFD